MRRIITRAEWGARHDNGSGYRPLPATQVWLHHSVTTAPDLTPPFDDDYAAIRALEQVGEDRFGRGISYTWPITPAGLVFEGHSVDRVGSHTANRNTVACAICFVGNYDAATPTAAQLRSAAWLLQRAHRAGWIDAPRLDGGHRDLKATACPGLHAYAAIPEINRLAAGPPVPEEDTVPVEPSDQHYQDLIHRVEAVHDRIVPHFEALAGRVEALYLGLQQTRFPDGLVEDNSIETRQQEILDRLADLETAVGADGVVLQPEGSITLRRTEQP